MRDKNLSRKTKLKIYKVAIGPILFYAAETMYMPVNDEEKIRTYESEVVRRFMGPKRTPDGKYRRWKIKKWKNL